MVSVVLPAAIALTSRSSPGEELESIQHKAGSGPLQDGAQQGSSTGAGSSTSRQGDCIRPAAIDAGDGSGGVKAVLVVGLSSASMDGQVSLRRR